VLPIWLLLLVSGVALYAALTYTMVSFGRRWPEKRPEAWRTLAAFWLYWPLAYGLLVLRTAIRARRAGVKAVE
jgi:hypothetical protein